MFVWVNLCSLIVLLIAQLLLLCLLVVEEIMLGTHCWYLRYLLLFGRWKFRRMILLLGSVLLLLLDVLLLEELVLVQVLWLRYALLGSLLFLR